MVLSFVIDAVLSVTTLTLRYTSFLFVRLYPIGPRFLPRLYANLVAYIILATTQSLISKKKSRQRRHHPAIVLLLGIIDRNQYLATLITVSLNALCVLTALDFVYRAHHFHTSHDLSFSRLGYVDSSSARIVFRAPGSAVAEVLLMPQSGNGNWIKGDVVNISERSDWVGTFKIENLLPDTAYIYSSNASHSGKFRTAQEHPKQWSIVQTSCIKPFYPYNPIDHALRVKGLEHLSKYINDRTMDLMLFLGDFIYIDLPYPLGWTSAHYTTAYRQVYASPSWTDSLRSLSWLHVYDDHEIINDWSANETGLYNDAIQPYWHYQGRANPLSAFGSQESYYTFSRGDVSFFLLDTRRYRSGSSSPDGPDKTMLGAVQLEHLREWLATETRWKVVVSSVPFTKNWRGPDAGDAWPGYLSEREIIFKWMRATDGVILLSGDRHEHATTIFPPPLSDRNESEGVSLIEFSTSALNQFYEPFNRFHKQIEDSDVSVYHHWKVYFELVVDGKKTWEYEWTYER